MVGVVAVVRPRTDSSDSCHLIRMPRAVMVTMRFGSSPRGGSVRISAEKAVLWQRMGRSREKPVGRLVQVYPLGWQTG